MHHFAQPQFRCPSLSSQCIEYSFNTLYSTFLEMCEYYQNMVEFNIPIKCIRFVLTKMITSIIIFNYLFTSMKVTCNFFDKLEMIFVFFIVSTVSFHVFIFQDILYIDVPSHLLKIFYIYNIYILYLYIIQLVRSLLSMYK